MVFDSRNGLFIMAALAAGLWQFLLLIFTKNILVVDIRLKLVAYSNFAVKVRIVEWDHHGSGHVCHSSHTLFEGGEAVCMCTCVKCGEGEVDGLTVSGRMRWVDANKENERHDLLV